MPTRGSSSAALVPVVPILIPVCSAIYQGSGFTMFSSSSTSLCDVLR